MPPEDLNPEILEASELIRVKMNKTVLEIATENADDFMWTDDYPDNTAVITLIDIALAKRNRWEKVIQTLERFSEEYHDISLATFPEVVKAAPKRRFIETWFFQDLKRYTIVERLASRFVTYQEENLIETELEAMQHWAKAYITSDGWPDPKTDDLLSGVSGLEVVDTQYLLMRLGMRTLKPDKRLRSVFRNLEIPVEDDMDLVKKGHEVASLLGVYPLVLDQLFW